MKGKHLLPLLASIILILVLVATSCTPTTTTPKQTTTKPGATTSQPQSKDTIYRVLNPVGIDQPVDLSPLAKRIDGLAGKTIAVSMAEGSPMVMPTLYERVKKEFPTSTIVYRESRTTGPTRLTDEELKPIQALIQGNAW
jgi:hypothetical protein